VRIAIPLFSIACSSAVPSPDVGVVTSEDGGFTVFDAGTDPDAGPPPIVEDWYRDAIGYELFVRSFQDSDGDGIGDLRGLIDRLDELEDLGVDLLWLLPIAKGSSWHGYEVTDHRAVDPSYGTMDDFDALIAAAHARDMRVVLDHVINHTSIEHPWFEGEHDNWYVWRDFDPGWPQPWSSNPAWHALDGRWYYGVFSTRLPDLDYTNADLRAEMLELASFWLDRGADGYRLDAARYLVETGPGPLQSDTAETHAFWRDFRKACDRARPAPLLVGEVWAENEIVARYFGDETERELTMTFDFDSSYGILDSIREGNASRAKATLSERLRRLPPWGEAGTFLTNHDQPRIATQLADQDSSALRLAAAILLTWPGTPWLYYGEEIGMLNAGGGYDTRRPMRWSDGFTSGTPWVPPANTISDPETLSGAYRALIRLRREHPALRRGLTQVLLANGSASEPLVLSRTVEGESLLVAYNFSTASNDVSISAPGTPLSTRFRDLTGGGDVSRASVVDDLRLTVEPRGFRVLRAEE
jgi:alpha-amylase